MQYYVIFAIIAMVFYGITAIIYKLASGKIDSVSLTLLTSVFMSVSIFVFWLFFKQKQITMKGIQYSGLAGVIAAIAFISFVIAISLGKVSVATTLRGLSFAVTVGIATLFLAEQITFVRILGIGFAIVAIICLSI